MPRSQDPVQDLFHHVSENGKKKDICKYCAKTYAHNTNRCRKHILQECNKVPAFVRSQIAGSTMKASSFASSEDNEDFMADNPTAVGSSVEEVAGGDTGRPPSAASGSRSGPRPSSAVSRPGSRLSSDRSSLDRFVDFTSQSEKAVLDEAFARAVYASAIPLSTFDNYYWDNFFQLLRPSYQVPSRYFLGGSLLDTEYSKCVASNTAKVQQASALGIMTDSYTNVRGESVINIIVTTPAPVVYKQIFRGVNRETGDYVGRELNVVIEEIGPEKFLLAVTDNANNMKLAKLIVTTAHPHITAIGCASHCWDLLLKDILDLISVIYQFYIYARKVVKFVKTSSNFLAEFTVRQREKYGALTITLKLHAKTRWGGAPILLNSVLKNKAALKETMVATEDRDGIDVPTCVRKCVMQDTFWDRIKNISDALTPIHAAITLIESNRALLSDVYYLHRKIHACVNAGVRSLPLTSVEKRELKELLDSRKEFTIAPIHLAAFMLDPRFRGEGLEDEEVGEAIAAISDLATRRGMDEASVIANLGDFRSNEGFFKTSFVMEAGNKKIHPSTWWRGLCSNQPLSKLAADLLQMPPTAAECERRWSEHGFIHNKVRNRLLNHKVSKLVTTRASLVAEARPHLKKKIETLPLTRVEYDEYFDKYLGEDISNEENDASDEEWSDLDIGSDEEWGLENAEQDAESEEELQPVGRVGRAQAQGQGQEIAPGPARTARAQSATATPAATAAGPLRRSARPRR